MENQSIGGYLLQGMLETLRTYFIETYTVIADSFYITGSLIVTLYIVFMGYRMVKGQISESLTEFFISLIVVPICFSIFFHVSVFEKWIYQPILATMMGLMSIGLGGENFTIQTLFVPIDASFSKIFGAVDSIMDQMGRWSLGQKIKVSVVSFILGALYGVLYLIFLVLIVGALFAVHVLVVLGPIFGTLAAFKQTRSHFTQWLKTIINYALIPVFTAIIMGITLTFLDLAIADMAAINVSEDGIFTKSIGSAMAIGFLSIYLHLKAPELANAITGGQASGVGNFFGGMAAVAGGGIAAAGMLGGNKLMGAAKTYGAAGMKNVIENGVVGVTKNAYSRMRGF